MNAEIENKTTEVLSFLLETLKDSKSFALEQTPLFIQELLDYKFYMSLGQFSLGVLSLFVGIGMLILFLKKQKEWEREGKVGHLVISFVSALLGIIIGFVVPLRSTDWIKIKIAPRVYLMDYIKGNIK